MHHMAQPRDLQHEICVCVCVLFTWSKRLQPHLTRSQFQNLDVIFLLDFNTYTRDPHKNLIKKTEFNNHYLTPKHVVDLSVELGVSLDFLLVFIHYTLY